MGGREDLQVVAQVTNLRYENAWRASGVDGVITRLFCPTEEEKHSSYQYRYFWISHWTADIEDITKFVQPDNDNKFFQKNCGRVWIAALLWPRCSDRFLCRLEGDSSEELSTKVTDENEIVPRFWSGSNQALPCRKLDKSW